MNRRASNERDRLSENVRREMRNGMTTRFFRSLPFFQTVETLPDQMRDLLARMDEAEGAVAHRR